MTTHELLATRYCLGGGGGAGDDRALAVEAGREEQGETVHALPHGAGTLVYSLVAGI